MNNTMTDVLLATANARYTHTSLSLRYLLANLGPLSHRAQIAEFTIDERPVDIAEKILDKHPRLLGLSVYLWNTTLLTDVVALIKRIRPDLTIVLGGPEVSYEIDRQPISELADYIIAGQGELAFRELCTDLFDNRPPKEKVIHGETGTLESIALPYHLYDDRDIAHRILYVESSRGCPFGCEFCLSCLDRKVRRFDINGLLESLEELWKRGARRFKFIDRALHLAATKPLLQFFLDRKDEDLFLHFELVPDRLDDPLLQTLSLFPRGAIQLEAGVQSFNRDVLERIGRKQNLDRVADAFHRLREETGIHLHSDLIVGLPGESLESFQQGFDKLLALGPQEIQVGILKRLRGAPIQRHDRQWGMIYNHAPPYDLMSNRLLDFKTMQRMKRFARYFDLFFNSGNFTGSVELIWQASSAFNGFLRFSDWLFEQTGRTNAIALNRLAEYLFTYLSDVQNHTPSTCANRIYQDFREAGRKSIPGKIQEYVTITTDRQTTPRSAALPPRQQRHVRDPGTVPSK